jgi:hypothetical protein
VIERGIAAHPGWMGRKMRDDREGKIKGRSFLKKRAKNRLDVGVSDPASVHPKKQKSFASFFQKRRPFV